MQCRSVKQNLAKSDDGPVGMMQTNLKLTSHASTTLRDRSEFCGKASKLFGFCYPYLSRVDWWMSVVGQDFWVVAYANFMDQNLSQNADFDT